MDIYTGRVSSIGEKEKVRHQGEKGCTGETGGVPGQGQKGEIEHMAVRGHPV